MKRRSSHQFLIVLLLLELANAAVSFWFSAPIWANAIIAFSILLVLVPFEIAADRKRLGRN